MWSVKKYYNSRRAQRKKKLNECFVYDSEGNTINHRTKLKLIVNPILRKIQFYTSRPWVIASECTYRNGRYYFVRYKIARVNYRKL